MRDAEDSKVFGLSDQDRGVMVGRLWAEQMGDEVRMSVWDCESERRPDPSGVTACKQPGQ